MAGFLYYVPLSRAALVRDGRLQHGLLPGWLSDVLADVHDVPAQCVAAETTRGPDDGPGVVLYPVPPHGELPAALGYFPDRQTWRAVPGGGGVSIGWAIEDPPRPTDLERNERLDGWICRDGHGQQWVIPAVRAPHNPRGNLPYAIEFDESDRPICAVAGRHRSLWQDSATLWDWALTRGQPDREGMLILGAGFTAEEDAFLLACAFRGLGVNYRVDRHVIAALASIRSGWLTQVFASLVVNALVDFQAKRAWDEAQKKTGSPSAAGGVSSTPGEPAAGPDTAPPAAS
jgi:hypothetical protein